MRAAMKRFLAGLGGLVLPALLAAQGTEPLRKTDLIRLLSSPMIPRGEVADLVRRNCLAFRPTERDWADLRGLGADAEVLSGIGGCAARQTSRAVVTLASGQPAASALGTSPPVPVATPPALPAVVTVAPTAPRAVGLAGGEALIRVGARRGDAPVRGVVLVLHGSSGIAGGAGRDVQAITDDSGLAVFRFPAGRQVANYHLEVVSRTGAALPGRPSVELAVRPGRPVVADVRPARLEVGAAPEGPVTIQVAVRDSFGNAVANEPLELRPERGDMGVVSDARVTDSLGRAAFVVQTAALRRPGRIELRARGERLAAFDAVFSGTAASAGTGFVSSGGQRGVARMLLTEPLLFQAHTVSGRPLSGRVVSVRGRNAQVRDSALTDSLGRARIEVTLGAQAGMAVVTASLDSVQAAETLRVDPGPAVELILERDGVRVDGGRILVERDVPFALTLKARDGYGNMVPTASLSRTLLDVLRRYNVRSQLLKFVGVQTDSLTAALKFKPVALGSTDLKISAGLAATVSVEVVRPSR
ncbi:MAG: hypothetical protein AUI99_04400 [Gemmatimonadetes bacterium 13_1_40CM_3_69_22]|nr:MAG: hypothetical protein AUH12_01310 [Gemmatimonadetes bacterium 13_2_20CM_69_8]OLD03470.1 MAG: hypothetical protein AUI99_04400 [Gemmatimonadetes bacterium 13_1_40CM_3_69_22]